MNKQERAYQTLRERILDGAYSPGYGLVIDALAEDFGVSVVPVREAIRRLEAEGLVVYRANIGAQVTPADPRVYEEELAVLSVLEGYATALAAPQLDDADRERLTEINLKMAQCLTEFDSLGFARWNQAFHLRIYERCPNPYLVGLLRDNARRLDAIRRAVFGQVPYRGQESIDEHHHLIELIGSQASFVEVETAAREHKLRTAEGFRAGLQHHPSLVGSTVS